MAKKVFKSKFFIDLFYKVMDEYWLDDDTYVIIFQDMIDEDGDTYHWEVEYHKDEERITYTRVYEYENVHDMLPTYAFKKQIDEYIMRQVGVIGENETLIDTTIEVKLRLAVPLDMKVSDYEEYLGSLSIEINRLVPTDKNELINKVKVLQIEKKK